MTPQTAAVDLLDEEPERVWDAEALHRALAARGIETSRENVRVILQRAVEKDRARRVRTGRYQSVRASAGTLPGVEGGDER